MWSPPAPQPPQPGTHPARARRFPGARWARARTAGTRAPRAPLPLRLSSPASRADPVRPPSLHSHSGSVAQLTDGRQTPGLTAPERSCGGASLSRRHSPRAPLPHPGPGSRLTGREPAAASPGPREERGCGDERRLRGHGRAGIALGRAREDRSPSGSRGSEPSRAAAGAPGPG